MAFITLRQLLDHAAEHGYGVPAFNINNMEQGIAIMDAARTCDAPVILLDMFIVTARARPLSAIGREFLEDLERRLARMAWRPD